MHTILPGEEVTIDYAMCDGTAYDEFDCACGAATCRGRVTGADWRNPALWERYAGHFSPYLERRIAALRRATRSGSGAGGVSRRRDRQSGLTGTTNMMLVRSYAAPERH